MKRACLLVLSAISILIAGCYDQTNLEELSFTLMMGLDVDDHDNFIVYSSSPVFNEEAKDNVEVQSVVAHTLREARNKIDATLTGVTIAGKNQSVLLSKRFVQQKENWFDLMDLFYREAKQSASPRVVLVDGPLSEIFNLRPGDKPRLPIHVRRLIDTAHRRNITVMTTLQDLRRQVKDRAMMPYISEIKREKREIKVTGTGLLSKEGKYATSLSIYESELLLILQNHIKDNATVSLPVNLSHISGSNNEYVAIDIKKIKRKIKTSFDGETFRFDVTLKLLITLLSKDFNIDIQQDIDTLKSEIGRQLQEGFTALIAKCQSHRVDPVGFGLHARAFQYAAWKSVQDQWDTAFAKAKIGVKVHIDMQSAGVTE
ncbi:Spore germination protein A3 [Paenibacillus solanacearum]|uniref:Spore germination protein A3 n=1 Tax=Paenibacillus solanacearum TaxID=2048548 RepID=A0A916JV55_9BACL|nr:Ger(x)C family spore germination protein [Paenibacillus solanacearum]CAG7600532.1 Spore germination protein A3 [Paenibacillus solanacearum]